VEWLRAGAGTRAVVRDRLADHTSREELCAAMARGPRLAVYLGHGRETGWTGYRALRWHHLAAHEQARPCGTVAAFACSTLKRTRGVVPFGTRWAMEGRAGAYFGSVAAVRVEPGFRMAEELGRVLAEGRRQTLGAAVAELHRRLSADPERGAELRELAGFRIIGNPLQPLY
jgi:hypothetical protein